MPLYHCRLINFTNANTSLSPPLPSPLPEAAVACVRPSRRLLLVVCCSAAAAACCLLLS
jgi:hypothetical protein